MTEWIYIQKGDKRPHGDVLVARLRACDTAEYRMKAAIFGGDANETPQPVVTVAHWHKARKRWVHGPRGEEVTNVYAWTFMPEPPMILEDRT